MGNHNVKIKAGDKSSYYRFSHYASVVSKIVVTKVTIALLPLVVSKKIY
jgi:hypothetical protein